jgi:hypothetical protein
MRIAAVSMIAALMAHPVTSFAGAPEVYETVNADRILLTHYCAMTPDGHQVRLQTQRIGATPDHLDFGFTSATNLHGTAAAHMRHMIMTISVCR